MPKENSFRNSIPCKWASKKCKKKCSRAKKCQKRFDRAALWIVYVYLISSTPMQKENPVANSVRQIKIRCAKYKFTKRSHDFLRQLLMQLMVGDLLDLDKFQTCGKGKFILEFRSVSMFIRNCNRAKKYQKMVCPSRPLESMCLID